MNDFIKFTGPADILAFIPHTLGETPTESFVAMTVQGNKLGATLRVDAPFGQDPVAYAQTIVSYLTADEAATGSLLVIYTDETTTDGTHPYARHVEALRRELETAEMPLQDAWLVTSELWRNYHCTDGSCCPAQSLDTITTSNGNAALIYRGSAVTGFSAPAPFTGDEMAREAIAAHKLDGWPEDLEASRAAWAKVLDDPKSLTTHTAHQLAGALQHPTIRDYMMSDIVPHAPEQFTSIMLGVFLSRPDWARVDTAQEVAFELMKATPEGQRAPMLCLIGWLEWLKGRSSFAARYFKLALEDVAGYRLAELLGELVNRGLIADCTRDPKKAYDRRLKR
ncbi:hypothetical protein Asphe3_41670 (plasmid) [Pseudarthrobacter phenanthrenivorans Sphe3]|uniref:DUF4192 domain-containing protein n=1 Tax=Pseudarthrobacter phenanthrenivorans (strain DSM 18606 / JCM 16027 / LMG 23796 / Sphe3) TaxID=930171 RepID=F0MCI1_PSEPM|nr:DUF4192 domain-containing protein [Pseudarthrobacter phenanthrenivorans]ADX75232.1 hypothetical protein Asphe3_41670 [Pseudarthrobacter phenanthrenivorans Sphe3]